MSTTTSERALSFDWMMFSAIFTLSAVSRMMIAFSCSLGASFLASTRLRSSFMTSFTSAFER